MTSEELTAALAKRRVRPPLVRDGPDFTYIDKIEDRCSDSIFYDITDDNSPLIADCERLRDEFRETTSTMQLEKWD